MKHLGLPMFRIRRSDRAVAADWDSPILRASTCGYEQPLRGSEVMIAIVDSGSTLAVKAERLSAAISGPSLMSALRSSTRNSG